MKNTLKLIKNKLNRLTSFWCPNFCIDTLKSYRIFEIQQVIQHISFEEKKVLEVGSGFGWQSFFLNKLGAEVKAVDIASTLEDGLQSSNFKLSKYKVFDDAKDPINKKEEPKIEYPVEKYDGINLPFENETFDIIYSSNVLTHVQNLKLLLDDMKRVLKKDGIMVHGCPTSSWCFWTLITGLIKKWYIDPRSHSPLFNNILIEIFNSRENFWKKYFTDNNLQIVKIVNSKLFYTGNSIFDSKISLKKRFKISKIFGSSTKFYVLKLIKN